MPRQNRGRASAPARPMAAPQRPVAPQAPARPQQSRPASTTAGPPATQQAPTQQGSQGPGLFGQMASTAAGVAVGSSIGHVVGGWFSGGSSAAPAEGQTQAATNPDVYTQTTSTSSGAACQGQITQFRQCLDQNQGDLNICGWYLDQLKACQQQASQY